MAGTMKSKRKKILTLFRLLGVALFVYIIFRVDLEAAAQALLIAKANPLALGILLQLVVLLSKGIRWHLMNDGRNQWKYWALSLGRFYESYAIGVVTPGRMGDLLKAGHESGRSKMLGSGLRVLAERGIDIGIFIGFAGLSALSGYYIVMKPVISWLIITGGSLVLALSVLILTSYWFTHTFNRLFSVMPGQTKKLAIEARRYPPLITAWIMVLSVVSNFSYFLSCYYLGKAVGIEAGFVLISGAVAISGLLSMLPVTIMGLGTRELAFLYVFKVFDQGIVIAFSLMLMLVAQIGGGLISFAAGQYLLLRTRKYNYD